MNTVTLLAEKSPPPGDQQNSNNDPGDKDPGNNTEDAEDSSNSTQETEAELMQDGAVNDEEVEQ